MSASNYADPDATVPDDIGPCRCPDPDPKQHAIDKVVVKARIGYGEKGRLRQMTRLGGIEAGNQALILIALKSWNLVLPDGMPRPLDAAQVALLDEPTIDALLRDGGAIDLALADEPLPNAPGAPSPDGPLVSASPTPTTPEPSSSTST